MYPFGAVLLLLLRVLEETLVGEGSLGTIGMYRLIKECRMDFSLANISSIDRL